MGAMGRVAVKPARPWGAPTHGGPAWLSLPAYLAILATGQHENTMVKIRLTRGGAKKRPFYHIIVTDQRSERDGRNIERVGFYNRAAPAAEKSIELDIPRDDHLAGQGAQLTATRRHLTTGRTRPEPADTAPPAAHQP